jgi:hypothetical protein
VIADRRRRQWVPLKSTFAHGKTGTNLKRKFGRDGLTVWVCYLAACKANWLQGQLDWTSEADGWTKLGLYGYEPEFTLASFFRYTGQLHLTSQRRSGDLTTTVCRRWSDWNTEVERDRDAEQKRRKRATNTPTSSRRNADDPPTLEGTDSDQDHERDQDQDIELKADGSKTTGNGLPTDKALLADQLVTMIGDDADKGTVFQVRTLASRVPMSSLAKVRESLQNQNPRDRAAYAVGALRSEFAELAGRTGSA